MNDDKRCVKCDTVLVRCDIAGDAGMFFNFKAYKGPVKLSKKITGGELGSTEKVRN
jgi:hypothetical protein